MANRLPLTTNKDKKRIEELPVGDYLDLSQSGIVSATSIQSDSFYGNLVGIASTAVYLSSAENILSGIVSTGRLSGQYNIDITGTANKLERAENILDGRINTPRLSGTYNIDITGGIGVTSNNSSATYYPTFVDGTGTRNININSSSLTFIPQTSRLGIGTTSPQYNLDVYGNVSFGNSGKVVITQEGKVGIGSTVPTRSLEVNGDVGAINFFGSGAALSGIVTQITAGIGVSLTPTIGQGIVKIESYYPTGKTIFVTQNGNDDNTGLAENYSKRTIKAAAAIAFPGDTIKVFPGIYVENNPIVLARLVSVEGTELRNCIVTPRYTDRDLFYTNNGVHITDLSFIGPDMSNGAAIVSLQPLLGVSTDRFFDAARMIRMNLDYIANESVGFLTSGFSGFAGTHREQDAARLIDSNLNYIAAEAVGFLTASSGSGGVGFALTDITNCQEDVVSIFGAVSYDLKANSNRKSVGAALSYFNNSGALQYITGPGVSTATISTLNYAVGIARSVIDNVSPPKSYQIGIGSITQTFNPSVIKVAGGCVSVGNTIAQLVGIVTTAIGLGSTSSIPTGANIRYGVTLESAKCAADVKSIWKCVINDITRGGNTSCVAAGKSYYDSNFNLIPSILKNPAEIPQTIKTLQYSFDVARAIVNNCTWGSYPVGLGTTVTNAVYNNTTGLTTITATNHGLVKDDAVKIVGLSFTCTSGGTIGTAIYPSGNLGYIFNVNRVVGINTFEVVVGQSTLPHTYRSGGTVQKYTNFQNNATQMKDLAMQIDPDTKYNNAINGCSNVVSAMFSCVGIVTNIVGRGFTAFRSASNPTGIITTYSGNLGIGFTSIIGITSAVYNNTTGDITLLSPGLQVRPGDVLEVRDLRFSCNSGGGGISTQTFPSGKFGYEFYVNKVNPNNTFVINVGVSSLAHNYVNGGFVVNRSIGINTVTYNNVTGNATITANGAFVKVGDIITLIGLGFTCPSGPGIVTYPSGNLGYNFPVNQVIGTAGTTFVVNVGTSTLPHTYVSGGIVKPAYSRGVGPITQGPYVRNCTNFVPKSIGMKIDGFAAEPGALDDIGVTGTMSVDSYTQYNQGGIGVSITNGAYAQLVSIFTICDDISVFTGSGGQCDITNSNSSFGRLGLVADGVGDYTTKSIYRYTGVVNTSQIKGKNTVVISGMGGIRPYDGQSCYINKLYKFVDEVKITNPGFGYIVPPKVTFTLPDGDFGITAQASSTIENGRVVAINIVNSGSQYFNTPTIKIDPPPGIGITATAEITKMQPIYYKVDSATLPSAGISTVSFLQNLNNNISAGDIVYFTRVSLQITSSHSFEWVGSGNDINTAKPALGGVVVPENEVVQDNGGIVVYTSTDQAGNFRIGDGVVINQATGSLSGRDFTKALFTTMTPFILALSD